ncbi:MAG: hypothetical protein QOG56_2465 [Solirubrobacteraceae bacterium]|nr:hypothetical protein [Solirubrobacteraceae bacterium]
MSDAVEVCVVGAGPAGAALATRLAQLGHDVAIVEQHPVPRPHVGESLSAGIWPLLELVGVGDLVAQAAFTTTTTARVRWRDEHERRVRSPAGLTVDRGAFDAILLRRAHDAGARTLGPLRARRPVRIDEGWELTVGDRVLCARLLADASGRRRLLGGRCVPTAPRTLALHAVWHGGPPPEGAQTRVEALADGWLWGAHLPGGGFRAMAFVDPQTLLATGRDARGLYHRLLAQSSLFAELPAVGARAGRVHACAATSYGVPSAIDESSVKVGEAAFAIDPLSSSGVQTAIQSALAAAACVHSILAPDGDRRAALDYYGEYQRHAVADHAATAARLYAEHEPHADAAFWRRRSAAHAPAPPPRARPAAQLPELRARRVRLAAGAQLRETACVIGDRVEMRRALTHPQLERPVAFLGGEELAPLLDALCAAPSLAQAVEAARRPAGTAAAVAWLHERGLLV